jgi:hypothetical protein
MKRLQKAEFGPIDRKQVKEIAKSTGRSIHAVQRAFEDIRENEDVYMNDVYQVNVRRIETPFGKMAWLSIKRLDKLSVHDWRDFQEIKNQLVGKENEGVELYPAESRRVDTSNQYHLFVSEDSRLRWPFGFEGREVVDGDGELRPDGSRQRPLKERKKS